MESRYFGTITGMDFTRLSESIRKGPHLRGIIININSCKSWNLHITKENKMGKTTKKTEEETLKEQLKNPEMRDISGYTASDIDVHALVSKEIAEEEALMGSPFIVRVYPTSYMIKLAKQLEEKHGTPHPYDSNYFKLYYKEDKFVFVGSCSNDENRYLQGSLDDDKLEPVTGEERAFKVNVEPLKLYQALVSVED